MSPKEGDTVTVNRDPKRDAAYTYVESRKRQAFSDASGRVARIQVDCAQVVGANRTAWFDFDELTTEPAS